jgi:hypothetical protein
MSKRVSVSDLQRLTDAYMEWAHKLEQLEGEMKDSTGETKGAYCLVYNDYLWKLQAKIGQLWYYVCGTEIMNPFTLEPTLPRAVSSRESVAEELQSPHDECSDAAPLQSAPSQ